MAIQFFSKTPRCGNNKIVTVGDAINQIPAFNALYESSSTGSVTTSCDDDKTAQWRKTILKDVIHCGGEPTEFDYFQNLFPSDSQEVDGTDVYVQYNCDKDYNIYAESGVIAPGGPGQSATFQMMRSMHAGAGKYSNAAVGGSIYIYEDHQWCYVSAVDKTTDYTHTVTVLPYNKAYTVNIREKKPMLFSNVRIVDGMSCMVPSSSWSTPAFSKVVRPYRIKKDWELAIELQRPYRDVMQFAIMWDPVTKKEIDSFELYETTTARREFMFDKNHKFFLGQKMDNDQLIGTGKLLGTNKYSGFDGVVNSLLFGGGNVKHIDPAVGFDLDSDFERVILQQDALKKSTEFFGLVSLRFRMAMERRSGKYFRNNSGACTFKTFERSGMDQAAVQKLGITSISWNGFTLHFKTMSAITDKRSIGNGPLKDMGIFMPGDGLMDDKGSRRNAIEFLKPGGTPETGTYEEIFRDHRKLDQGCEKLSGTIAETFQMVMHCPQNWMLMYPITRC